MLPIFLKDGDSFTACPNGIDALMRDVWMPILKRVEGETIPSWDTFAALYEHHLRDAQPLTLSPLNARPLRKALSKMANHNAAGLDYWEVACLKALGSRFLCCLSVCRILCCLPVLRFSAVSRFSDSLLSLGSRILCCLSGSRILWCLSVSRHPASAYACSWQEKKDLNPNPFRFT